MSATKETTITFFVEFRGRNTPVIRKEIKTGARGQSEERLARGARYHLRKLDQELFPDNAYDHGYRMVTITKGDGKRVSSFLLEGS